MSLTEEELKRLNEALARDPGYSAVGFSYDQNSYDPEQPTADNQSGRAVCNVY